MDTQKTKQIGENRRDNPWIFRTYAGHSTAKDSNRLFRSNLDKGQTGLSVAFDLPTQTGYDPDHPLAKGEVGKVGVPISHLGDMRTLFDHIPLDRMNTSMTINATAPWLLALYIAVAKEQGVSTESLQGTVQNDIFKEYLSRGTYVFPAAPSLRLTCDVIRYTASHMPKWNPMNVCSYHLQEAGATPELEVAFALATARAVLDSIFEDHNLSQAKLSKIVASLSFFVNAGMRFVSEVCKLQAFSQLWDEMCLTRYGVEDARMRRFRYGVQVNSLGLTEPQAENNILRIVIEMLGVVLSKNARARAVQLPAWNEALGLPRPWDQQWSLRAQQIMAFETDLLEYDDIFDGNPVIHAKVEDIKLCVQEELQHIDELGGPAHPDAMAYMKARLVEANTARVEAIENEDTVVVGVNRYVEGETSPLGGGTASIQTVDPKVEQHAIEALEKWRKKRDPNTVKEALAALKKASLSGENIMPPSIACAEAGVTTGEWASCLRGVFGEFRAPTGISAAPRNQVAGLDAVRDEIQKISRDLGSTLSILIGKPGLDGHSNGAEQLAVRARDCGVRVIYGGIRMTVDQLIDLARKEKVHAIGLSILSGNHILLVEEMLSEMKAQHMDDVLLFVGGIIPHEDIEVLRSMGVDGVFTPKDFKLSDIILAMARRVREHFLRSSHSN